MKGLSPVQKELYDLIVKHSDKKGRCYLTYEEMKKLLNKKYQNSISLPIYALYKKGRLKRVTKKPYYIAIPGEHKKTLDKKY